jgi:sugar phosphate isomerase/epimerase
MIKLCAFADEAGNLIEEQIKALNENNISLIEIRNANGKNVADFTFNEAREYNEKFSKNGIKVWSIGSPLGKTDIDCDFEEYKKKIIHIFEIAKIFRCGNIRIFSFFKAYEKKEKVFEYLKVMCNLAKPYNINLCHENEKDIYGDTLKRVKEIAINVPDLKLIFDPANYIQCGQNVKEALNVLRDKTYYYHIKDALYKDGSVVPAGLGDGMIKEIIEGIDNRKDTVLTIEPHLALFEGYSSIDNTQLKNIIEFDNNRQAFDYAVNALKKLLAQCNYKEQKGGFVK